MASAPLDKYLPQWLWSGLLVFAVILIVVGATSPVVLGLWHVGQSPAPPPPPALSLVTEADFENTIPSGLNGELGKEWRAARADHRLLVHALLACKSKLDEINSMTPRMFSALLLDLNPDGSHALAIKETASAAGHRLVLASTANPPLGITGSNEPSGTASPVPTPDLVVTSDEWQLLGFSDAIARARLLAVEGKAEALSPADMLWWTTLVVSGLATLFVTLQAKMRSPEDLPDEMPQADAASADAQTGPGESPPAAATSAATATKVDQPKEKEAWLAKRRASIRWKRRRYDLVAFLAISLTITVTSLTALKQYFDPIRAVVQNEQALRGLRQLHQQVMLAATCNENHAVVIAASAKKEEWPALLEANLARIISPYATTGNPDVQTNLSPSH